MQELYMTDSTGQRRKARYTKCLNCKKKFLQRKNGDQKYCSIECFGLKNRNRKKIKCSNCKKIIERTFSDLEKTKHNIYFCSRKCKDEGQKIKNGIKEIWPNHYATKGDFYLYKRYIDEGEKFCELCGEEKKFILQIHHKDGNRKNNKKNNLKILCPTCHSLHHLEEKNEKIVLNHKTLTTIELFKKLGF